MATHTLRRYAGWAALAAGGIQILGLIFLILFFAVELPQGSASTLRFGFLSDSLPILAGLLFLVVVVVLFLIWRTSAPLLRLAALLFGAAAALLVFWTNLMFVLEEISLEEQVQLFYISLALLGSWHILLNFQARREGFLPWRLTMFGLLVGVGQIMMFLLSRLLGGYEEMMSLDLEAILTNIPLLIALVIVIPMALIGYLGAPFWLVWLGWNLTRENTRIQIPDKLDARGRT